MKSQTQRVLERLRQWPLTHLEAERELSVMRLAARINELRREHRIETTMIEVKNRAGEMCRIASYWLRNATPTTREDSHG